MTLRYSLSAAAFLFVSHAAVAQLGSPQAPPPQLDAPTHIPALTLPNATTAPRTFPTQAPATVLALNKPIVVNRTCLAMRSYNYTADANNPQLSSATTCTVTKSNGVTYAIAPATR